MNSYSLDYIDDLYVQYVQDPDSVSETWRKYFEQFVIGAEVKRDRTKLDSQAAASGNGRNTATIDRRGSTGDELTDQALWMSRIQDRVNQLVREYRVRGHLAADLDPLALFHADSPELSPTLYGLSNDDLSRPLDSSALANVSG